jgi:hypothetical protein
MFDKLNAEASRLHNAGFVALAKIIRDATATGDADRVNGAVIRVSGILETGKRYTEAKTLRQMADNIRAKVSARLWG